MQGTKAGPSSGAVKKKNFKDREKRKSQSNTVQTENGSSDKDKNSPTKDCKEYAGISSESIRIYAEQTMHEPHLSEELCNTLAEDINYKLRYIIHDSLIKARLKGRDAISSGDIEESFSTLSIDKVYGAPSSPNWVPFGDQNLSYLDDTIVNLMHIAEDEAVYAQEGDVSLIKTWNPDVEAPLAEGECEAFKEYFTTVCQSVISNDANLRTIALQDISENSAIGPIVEWFYHFAYFLLMKDITYDCLTLRALNLMEILENSPLPNQNVSVKQLKLLVRLLLQRLLISVTTRDILKPMCSVLALLCLREPLRRMVIMKINQKITSVCEEMTLPLLTIIYFLGIESVKEIFLPNIRYFLSKVSQLQDPDLIYIIQAIYGLICKAEINEAYVHESFSEVFGNTLVIFWKPLCSKPSDSCVKEIDFINMKNKLIKTRRKVDCNVNRRNAKKPVEEFFEIPMHKCKVRTKLEEFRRLDVSLKKETHVTVGKTSLLLSVLRTKRKTVLKCSDHSLLAYNI